MYKVIKNLNSLCNYLDTKYGVDKADEILLNEYNYRRIHEVKQPNLAAVLNTLRQQWIKYYKAYKVSDKRTKYAKHIHAQLLTIQARAITYKSLNWEV